MKKNKAISKILSIALVLTIIFSSAFIASSANNNDFAAKHTQTQYNDKNGLPDNSINDILATSDGMMWFASSSGLIKYNSKNFQLINKNNSNDYGAINAVKLFEDSQKRLWIGTNDGGIICKSKTQTKTINMKPWAASNSVKDIKELSTGIIVVATNKGVFYIDNDFNVNSVGVMPGKRQDASASLNVNMLAVNFKDNILGVTANGNLFSIVDGKAELHNNIFKEYKLTCVYLIGNNIFRIGTTSGDIIDLTYNEKKEHSIKITKTTGNSINSMYKDSNDIWWVLTDTKIGYLDEKSTYVEVNNLHIDKYINTMYEDYQGNYWFGSNTYGVLKLSASSFVNYNSIYSLPKFLATAVTHFDDKTYIATDSGLKVINEKSRENVENTLTKLLKNKKINDLRTDLNNNIWIATEDSGLIKYSKDGAIKAFTVADGMLGTAVQKVFMGTNDKVLVGTSEGISIISNNKIIHNYKCNENIGSSVISIYEDSQSRIYIGTENEGVKKIDVDGTISNIIKAEGNPPGNVSSVIKDPNKDGVWASIGSSLCYVTTDGKVKKIEKLSLSRAIVDIFFTPDGNMWVVTPSEVLVLNTDNLLSDNEKLVVTRLNKSSGLYSNVYQLSHNFLSPEGILYLCCDEGINTINTLDYKISQPIPKITLNVVASETKAYPSSGKIKLSAEEEKLSFNVSVLSYSEYSDCKISYMLEGLDKAPIIVSPDLANVITYSNLKGGNYKFKMRVVSAGQEVGGEITLDIEKELSLTEKAAFKFTIITIAFALVMLLICILIILRARVAKNKEKSFKRFTDQSITSISKVVDAKDPYTRGHSERVAKYSTELARRYGLNAKLRENIYYAALLHDIGKIGIPDYILTKPKRLTPEEFEIMKKHTEIGAEILSGIKEVKGIANGARDHHEKYNGTGYPRGLKGTKISLEGRIIGAADAYDAMASEREYSKPSDKEYIISEIKAQKGEQFDPRMAEIFIQMINDGYFDKDK